MKRFFTNGFPHYIEIIYPLYHLIVIPTALGDVSVAAAQPGGGRGDRAGS
jgi:hypothetical protein